MTEQQSRLIPNLVYEDADAAIAWLDKAFGFACTLRVAGDGASVVHAQLVNDGAMIMLSSLRGDAFGRHFKQPDQAGCCTQGIYLVVADVGAAYERGLAAGAQVEMELQAQDYGGSGFTVRDCGGHIRSFGDYNPWQFSVRPGA